MILLRVFIPFAAGYFLSYLFRVVNAVIAPDLTRDIGLDAADLGLLTSTYFLAFAAFQLPLGILLDRFGPRRTEATLLLFAAAGTFIFSTSESTSGLIVGRALIGLGTSACLMAAFKAFVMWFPSERLPLVNGVQMAAGGLGALTATAPVEAALQFTDWRGVFLGLSVLAAIAAAAIFLIVPERESEHTGTSFREQIRGTASVFKSPVFWRIAPLTVIVQAAFLSIQSLWSGPWLHDVAGLDRGAVADHLLLIAASMVVGFVVNGAIAERLARIGIKPITVATIGMGALMAVQAAIIFHGTAAPLTLWMLFGFCGTTAILPYASLSQSFPPHLAGRVITGLNVMAFSCAFLSQWGIGVIINRWPQTADGGYAPEGYQAAFGAILALEVATMAWMALFRKNATEVKA